MSDPGITANLDPVRTTRAEPEGQADPDHPVRTGLPDLEVEPARTHPLTYLALALASLALLLSLAALAKDDGGGYRAVRIGENDCVIGDSDDQDVLYCRAVNVP